MRSAFAGLLIGLFLPSLAAAQVVTTGKATLKKHPGDDTRSLAPSASLSAARNEFEAFELYIYNDTSSNLQNIDVSSSNFTSGTAVIPASSVWLYREAYLYVGAQTSNNEVPQNQYWPDPLVPRRDEMFNEYRGGFQNFGPKDPSQAIGCPLVAEGSFSSCNWIPPGENRVVFVEILVPSLQADGVTKTPAGNYNGTITVTFNVGNAHPVSVALQVYDFDLPATATLRTFYNANFTVAKVDVAHNGFDSAQMTTYNAWSKLYGRYLLDHRISASMINATTVAYSPSGSDFSRLDSTFGELFDGTTDAKSRLKGARETAIPFSWRVDPSTGNNLDQHAQWESHFKSKNWWSRTFDKICDEPPATCTWNALHTEAQSIHNNASTSDFLLMVTTDPKTALEINPATNAPNDAAYATDIDILTPTLTHVYNKDPDENGVSGGPWAGYQLSNGSYPASYTGKLWWYQGCYSHWCDQSGTNHPIPAGSTMDAYFRGWPDLVIDVNTAAVNRTYEWLTSRYGIVGVHYYDVFQNFNYAWESVYAFGGQGDGTLLYPGTPQHHNDSARFVVGIGGVDDVPVSSLRLKMIREGIEDYEYLNILKSRGDGAFADNAVEDLFQVAHGIVPPPYNAGGITVDALYAKRSAVAQRIVSGSNPILSVTRSGLGGGTVTSTDGSIVCGTGGSACSAAFAPGSQVTLTATPDSGSSFYAFSGDCAGSSCTLTMNGPRSVTATFDNACSASDCFRRPDSATLGSGWDTYAPALQITNHQAANTDAGTKAARWLNAVGPDQDLYVDCQLTGAGSNCGLMGRWSDANDFYYAFLDSGLGQIYLYRLQAGSPTQLGSAPRAIASGRYYRLRLVIQGSGLSVYFNNESSAAISITDSALSSGDYAGLHLYAGAAQSVWYGDFNAAAVNTPTYAVSITKSGSGTGRVTSQQGPIDCGATCSTRVPGGTQVTLVASADSGSSFGGFSGGCTSNTTSCVFTPAADTAVNAVFTANDFSITANPASASAPQGGTATYTVSTQVTSGAAQTVTFSVSGLPAGVSASFNPASVIAGGSSTLTLTVGSSTAPGTYGNLNVVGTGTATTHSTVASLTVTPATSIAFRASSTYSAQSENTMNIQLAVPSSVQPNDVLIATVYVGDYHWTTLPAITAPQGWTLVSQTAHGTAGELLLYSRVANASDPGSTYSWASNLWVGATASIVAYSGANTASPVTDASAGQDNPSSATSYSTPTINISANGGLLVATWAGYRT